MANDLDRVLAALAAPTRRRIVDHLRRGPRRAGELAPASGAVRRPARVAGRGGRVLERTAGGVQGARRARAQGTPDVSAADGVRVSLDVAVEPAVAFEVFTTELDAWWGRGPRFRFVPPYAGSMRLEPGLGGRLLHVVKEAGRIFEGGRIEAWEPPSRLAFTWRLANFRPGQITRVEVRFEPVE